MTMHSIKTMMCSLLLSSLTGCGPPIGPDQQEAGPEKSGEVHDISSTHTILDEYRRCFDGCADKSTAERPTCHDNCADKVSAAGGNPTASACPRSCSKKFGSCLAPCGDERNEDDAASCRRLCQLEAESCVNGCN
jgi:predicted small lipoprotein YifL